MFGNGAAIGMEIIVHPLRPIRQAHPAAPTASAVVVVGTASRGAAVYLTAAATRLTTVSTSLASVFVFSSSSERHDTAAAGLSGNDARPSGRIVRQARSLYVNPQIYP